MARRITRKQLKQDEFVSAAFDFGAWIEAHWKQAAVVVAAVALVVLGVAGWMSWRAHRMETAREQFGEGFDLYRKVEAEAGAAPAEYGDADARFEQAAQIAGRTPLGRVARYYQGLIDMRRGQYADAAGIFEEIEPRVSDPVLKGTVKASLAEALASSGQADRAEQIWRELASGSDGVYPAAAALVSLGRLLQDQGKNGEAKEVFGQVLKDYPQSPSAAEANSLLPPPGAAQ